jgi:hypothetical protein
MLGMANAMLGYAALWISGLVVPALGLVVLAWSLSKAVDAA